LKPLIAVSACLLGQPVRYDGASKPDPLVLPELENSAQLIAVCPEVAIGLGVPRPKIELVQQHGRLRVLGVDNRRLDVTGELTAYAQRFLRDNPELAGLVLKSRSPSCGINNTPLFDVDGNEISATSGMFAQTIMALRPDLPLIDEIELAGNTQAFLDACRQLST